jgi:hypothetical protein
MRARQASLLAAALLCSTQAAAGPYDLRLYKLGNPDPGEVNHDPRANANFRAFSRQFAAALTSVTLMPPETLGHAAFSVSAELSTVQLQQDTVRIPTQRLNAGRSGIEGWLLMPSLHVRKGLPWSLEMGARVAWIEKSAMVAGTGEVKWALNEGFAYLPDLGVRGHVTRLFNTKDFDLTAAGVDLGLGKQFAIGGMITLTPYAGWNLVWVASNSNTIDFDPGRTHESHIRTPSAPFENISVFDEVSLARNSHNRFYGGLRFIGGALQLGAEYSVSQLPRIPVDTGGDEPEFMEIPAVTAINFTVGLDF